MVSISDLRECANQALGNSEHRAIAGGRRCAEFVQRLLSTEPITEQWLLANGWEGRIDDWGKAWFAIDELEVEVEEFDDPGSWELRVRGGGVAIVKTIGALTREMLDVELDLEVQEAKQC